MAGPSLNHPAASVVQKALLDVVRETVGELRREPAQNIRVTLATSLDRDLGLDSLARVELLLRIERTFGVTLPENTLQLAETPRHLLAALLASRKVAGREPPATGRAAVPPVFDGAAAAQPAEASTLIEVLDWHLHAHADVLQIRFLSDAGEEEISYAKLRDGAAAVAIRLRNEGLMPRQTVAVMLPTCPEYFYTYFGILMAGGIPVPIYPPARLSQIEDHVRRHAGILDNAQAVMLVTVREAMTVARILEASVPGLQRVLTADAFAKAGGDFDPVPIAADDIAFIQYTSGSTGNPKGVVLTHANLLANIRAIGEAVQVTPRDVFVSWLPLYHDMGLISAWLASLYFGNPLVVMSPLRFLADPARWLWAIHRHRGTLTAAPNFAYEFCLKRVEDGQIEGLDLSSLRLMANGAEPVSPDTLERFGARFGHYGLDAAALAPVYGLAESTVGLLCPPMGRGLLVDRIRREPFTTHGKALPAPPDDPNPLRFVACGRPLPGHRVRIVDEAGEDLGERTEGRLEFQGPSSTRGYYRNPEQTRRLFDDGWLDTGDRAYSAQGDVYITGRVKDIIIRGGRNIYPHELEEVVGALPGVRKGCVAVFGSADPQSGTERLIVLAEARVNKPDAPGILREEIYHAVLDVLGEAPDEVVLAPPHTVLKTSSGKIRRAASRELYESGLVGAGAPASWRIFAGLSWRLLRSQSRRYAARAAEVLYCMYMWMLFWLIAPVAWLITVATPRPTAAWAVARIAARLFLKLSGSSLTVNGVENVPRDMPGVMVVNHASYVDGLILVASLPSAFSFVAKRELRGRLVSRIFLERMGAEFVERFAAQQGVDDANRLAEAASRGKPLVFFPEGTFTRRAGLLPFHLGAFIVAARARVPVIPVAIRGSRALLRGKRWFPRRSAVVVTIGAPIMPPDNVADAFAAAVQMRAAAREEIVRHCGEPDIGSGEVGGG